ncbi:ARHGQ factor, partial [Polypterus senegalus]
MMEGGNEVDLSNNNITPLWKKRSGSQCGSRDSNHPKPRPLSYQINGVMMTDFPVEDKCNMTLTQPAEKISSPRGTVFLKHVMNKPMRVTRVVRSISIGHLSNGKLSFVKNKMQPQRSVDNLEISNSSRATKESSPSLDKRKSLQRRISSPLTLTSERDQIIFTSSPEMIPTKKDGSLCNNNHIALICPLSQTAEDQGNTVASESVSGSSIEKQTLERQLSNASQSSDKVPSIILSTNSTAAFKNGTQQIIPKELASEIKASKNNQSHQNFLDPGQRALRSRSMVETTGNYLQLVGDTDGDTDPEVESPGTLKRGLRSTSYRRAVVSGIDSTSVTKKDNRLSQPVLRIVEEDKEKYSSLGRAKKKGLTTQGTFDDDEDAVLYQNYKEKALENDSDEDLEMKEPKSEDRIIVQYRPLRSTWSQLSVAIFEVISSEYSYLHSLEILIRMFKNSSDLSDTMTKTENHHLFSNITDVYEASKKFFKELEERHQQSIVIDDISDIVEKHSMTTFDPYVKYCSNEVYQQRTLQKLLTNNPSFKEVLSGIESNPECRNLPMISFLILPMQRVTRLPLLMDTICQKTAKDSQSYESCKKALQAVSKPFPLVSSSRWLVKRGELTAFVEENGIFLKRTSRQQVYFFLFNDVLIVTRKKSTFTTVISYVACLSVVNSLHARSRAFAEVVEEVCRVGVCGSDRFAA